MAETEKIPPVQVAHLFRRLDQHLMQLLSSLTEEDWNRPTTAKLWKVKDVAAHLLDGNIRTLSIQRDHFFGEAPPAIKGYQDLVDWLNQLNADWVKASQRISPSILLLLHQATGALTSAYYESVNVWEKAIFAVDWAGESESLNWMHLAREYTEKWHHQQQIRDAVGSNVIMSKEFFYPCIHTFMYGLPHTFRNVEAAIGTIIEVEIVGEAGGSWYIEKGDSIWKLENAIEAKPDAIISIKPDLAWKIFTKAIPPAIARKQVEITGNEALATQVLQMVAVMA